MYDNSTTYYRVCEENMYLYFSVKCYSLHNSLCIKVSKALSEEIHRLSTLVDEFNLPFHSELLVLNVYKKELHLHVENGLGSNLRARLSTALAMNIENSQREMAGTYSAWHVLSVKSYCSLCI